MDLGHIPVLEYCFGLISAIFTEWDSIQCSCVVLVLNSKHIYRLGLIPVCEYCSGLISAIFTEWDSIQCPCTALVLNAVILPVLVLNSNVTAIFKCNSYIY